MEHTNVTHTGINTRNSTTSRKDSITKNKSTRTTPYSAVPRPLNDSTRLVLTPKGMRILQIVEKCPSLTLYRGGWGSLDEKKGLLNQIGPVFVSKAMSYQANLPKKPVAEDICIISTIQHELSYKFFPRPVLNETIAQKTVENTQNHNVIVANHKPDSDSSNEVLEAGRKADELERQNHAKSTYMSAENGTMPSKYISSTYSLERAKEWASNVIYKFTPDLDHTYVGNDNEQEILILGGSFPANVQVSVDNGRSFISLDAYKVGVKHGLYS